jgi:hypothetical protein
MGQFPAGEGISSVLHSTYTHFGPHPAAHWTSGSFLPAVKRPEHEVHHPPPSGDRAEKHHVVVNYFLTLYGNEDSFHCRLEQNSNPSPEQDACSTRPALIL